MNKKAFTMTELIVAITIVVILSAIGFTAYSGYISNARDTQRKSDFSRIQTALKSYKFNRGLYPEPGESFDIKYDTHIVAKQGRLNESVKLSTFEGDLPVDPKNKVNYFYSVTRNNGEYQIAGTLENDDNPIAILKGDYQTVSKNILPTIMLATTNEKNINDDSGKKLFIFDGKGYNLPYELKGDITTPKTSVTVNGKSYIQNQTGTGFWQNSDFRNCAEIKEAGKALFEGGSLKYQVVSGSNYANATCDF